MLIYYIGFFFDVFVPLAVAGGLLGCVGMLLYLCFFN